MTFESIVSLATSAVALGTAIWAHRRIPPKPQAPITKEELYGSAAVPTATTPVASSTSPSQTEKKP